MCGVPCSAAVVLGGGPCRRLIDSENQVTLWDPAGGDPAEE
jgi:hypothetical protein